MSRRLKAMARKVARPPEGLHTIKVREVGDQLGLVSPDVAAALIALLDIADRALACEHMAQAYLKVGRYRPHMHAALAAVVETAAVAEAMKTTSDASKQKIVSALLLCPPDDDAAADRAVAAIGGGGLMDTALQLQLDAFPSISLPIFTRLETATSSVLDRALMVLCETKTAPPSHLTALTALITTAADRTASPLSLARLPAVLECTQVMMQLPNSTHRLACAVRAISHVFGPAVVEAQRARQRKQEDMGRRQEERASHNLDPVCVDEEASTDKAHMEAVIADLLALMHDLLTSNNIDLQLAATDFVKLFDASSTYARVVSQVGGGLSCVCALLVMQHRHREVQAAIRALADEDKRMKKAAVIALLRLVQRGDDDSDGPYAALRPALTDAATEVVSEMMRAGKRPYISSLFDGSDAPLRARMYRLLAATRVYEHSALSAAIMDATTPAPPSDDATHTSSSSPSPSSPSSLLPGVAAAALEYMLADALDNYSDERSNLAAATISDIFTDDGDPQLQSHILKDAAVRESLLPLSAAALSADDQAVAVAVAVAAAAATTAATSGDGGDGGAVEDEEQAMSACLVWLWHLCELCKMRGGADTHNLKPKIVAFIAHHARRYSSRVQEQALTFLSHAFHITAADTSLLLSLLASSRGEVGRPRARDVLARDVIVAVLQRLNIETEDQACALLKTAEQDVRFAVTVMPSLFRYAKNTAPASFSPEWKVLLAALRKASPMTAAALTEAQHMPSRVRDKVDSAFLSRLSFKAPPPSPTASRAASKRRVRGRKLPSAPKRQLPVVSPSLKSSQELEQLSKQYEAVVEEANAELERLQQELDATEKALKEERRLRLLYETTNSELANELGSTQAQLLSKERALAMTTPRAPVKPARRSRKASDKPSTSRTRAEPTHSPDSASGDVGGAALVDRSEAATPALTAARKWTQQEQQWAHRATAAVDMMGQLLSQLPAGDTASSAVDAEGRVSSPHLLTLWMDSMRACVRASSSIHQSLERLVTSDNQLPTIVDVAATLLHHSAAACVFAEADSLGSLCQNTPELAALLSDQVRQTKVGPTNTAANNESNTLDDGENARTALATTCPTTEALCFARDHVVQWMAQLVSLKEECTSDTQRNFVASTIAAFQHFFHTAARATSETTEAATSAHADLTFRVTTQKLQHVTQLLDICQRDQAAAASHMQMLRVAAPLMKWTIRVVTTAATEDGRTVKAPATLHLLTNCMVLVAHDGEGAQGATGSTSSLMLAAILPLKHTTLVEPRLGLTMFSLNVERSNSSEEGGSVTSETRPAQTHICLGETGAQVEAIRDAVHAQTAAYTGRFSDSSPDEYGEQELML
ncbi:hypothetical protein PTSG_12320 [Salpingoeca rosetta]|uniref:Uncharacterized protein n=1 Tax=Salpingoeca rosetta (strain ATCC 50818 / BSB-021) TaxID=946362 RepID=F2UB98_SALR5|nr:uncharacterized protein PTSG_12320 [Salpingoeca rosetta]EGD73764.1 hypothetical protein PTSG_12320 [Salpingoeca rosetta]|eukprot:XP_004993327.1 hypothetical protein PTSG_12320 [Salpingoeca rosetta]